MHIDDIYGKAPGAVVATHISEEEYLDKYAEHFCEWINGTVIRIAPETLQHGDMVGYLYTLLKIYSELNPTAQIVGWPFPMRLAEIHICREPNLMVILHPRQVTNEDIAIHSAADICIEVVSEESTTRDLGEKFIEYEKGGVGEYWIFDYHRSEALFYRRDDQGIFVRQSEDADGNYQTPLLPGLLIHVPTLWLKKLPGPAATARAVEAMLKS